jgi:hypothetical protein
MDGESVGSALSTARIVGRDACRLGIPPFLRAGPEMGIVSPANMC